MKQIVREVEREVITLDEVTKDKGYVMVGDKGNYILAQDTNRKFIWVKAEPGSITKPARTYNTIEEAIEAKLDKYEVFQFNSVIFA